MNEGLKKILLTMLSKNIIGNKHFPEDYLIKSRIKNLSKDIQKEFYYEYKILLVKGYFWRLKKRTGKGSEFHISINPSCVEAIIELIGDIDEND